MKSKSKKNTTLVLNYIGEDFWSRPVYKDQFGHLWKDENMGESEQLSLHSVSGDEFDGDPDALISQEYVIKSPAPVVDKEKSFQYMMLDRLRSDCDYYLGYGHRYPGALYCEDEKEHIEHMKKIWLSFAKDEKPEWLTWEQIENYEKEMCKEKSIMTRRRVLFTAANGIRYITPEFNGDKSEMEKFCSADSCEKDWDEIAELFRKCRNYEEFEAINIKAQSYYHSCLPDAEVLPCRQLRTYEEAPTADKILYVFG